MWNEGENCFERGLGAARTAGQVHNQGSSAGSGKPTAQGGKLGLLPAFSAHQLGKAIQQPLTNGPGGFRGHVAGGNASSAGGNDEVGYLALPAQCVLYLRLLVRNYDVADDLKSVRPEQIRNGRPRYIYPLPPKAGVAHGNDSGTHPTIVSGD